MVWVVKRESGENIAKITFVEIIKALSDGSFQGPAFQRVLLNFPVWKMFRLAGKSIKGDFYPVGEPDPDRLSAGSAPRKMPFFPKEQKGGGGFYFNRTEWKRIVNSFIFRISISGL